MKNFSLNSDENISAVKAVLPEDDVLTFNFTTPSNARCAVIYADGICNKALLSEQVIRPLSLSEEKITEENLKASLYAPEVNDLENFNDGINKILDGDALLIIDGLKPVSVGMRSTPIRAVSEPPTDVAVKGPRQGFIEDLKTNTSLVRTRLKSKDLKIEFLTLGRRSKTKIAVFYLSGIADESVVKKVKKKLSSVIIDNVPDSSYVAKIISERPTSILKQVGSSEKPDIFCANIAEGRVGIIVDGSPIALTVPYLLIEDFQSAEDYYVNPVRAGITRFIRLFSLLVSLYLPAFYVSAQLFKIQLIPLSLLMTIASGTKDLSISPGLEMTLVLFVLEVLNEASIRMPKYVGLALSVVGALVLGDTAVSAGIVSTMAIIIIAFSGICLYTVPNLTETTTILRWILLFLAGSVGPYGIVLFSAYFLYSLATSDFYGVPVLSPIAPLVKEDMQDSFIKFGLYSIKKRPKVLKSKNEVRFKNEN